MSFRASSIIPENAFALAKKLALSTKNQAARASLELAAPTDGDVVLSQLNSLVSIRQRLLDISAVPGIAQYAKDQENDQTYDVVAEFNALIGLLEAARDEITATFPVDAGGFILSGKFNADGSILERTFTTSQLTAIKARFDAIFAGIS